MTYGADPFQPGPLGKTRVATMRDYDDGEALAVVEKLTARKVAGDKPEI